MSKDFDTTSISFRLVHSTYIRSGVTGGGGGGRGQGAECPPETSDREVSADLSGKERQRGKEKRGNEA